MKPTVRSSDGLLQLRYDLPHRVLTTKVSPLSSPNGSTIIVYGHEQGLRFIWKGGRPYKQPGRPLKDHAKPNGASQNVVMVIDSDNEEPAVANTPEKDIPSFEEEELELDPSAPYDQIIHTLDLILGVEVLHIAFPYLPSEFRSSRMDLVPKLLAEKLVIAVACSDLSIRLLTMPLMPPSPQDKAKPEFKNARYNVGAGKSAFGEHMFILPAQYQSIPRGISLSFTFLKCEDTDDTEMDYIDSTSERLDAQGTISNATNNDAWNLLVASHSADLSGLLLVHRIPLTASGTEISKEPSPPWHSQYLATRAVSVEFCSALYPASEHSRILVAEAGGSVRVFDCLPKSRAAEGSWLLTFYTSFEHSANASSKRKQILAAQWVLGGKAILVLLADGLWGVYDLENAGLRASSDFIVPGNVSARSLVTFAIDGRVGQLVQAKNLLKNSNTEGLSRPKLAPMTPGTRKSKQEALFTGPAPRATTPLHGGVHVSPTQQVSNRRAEDESVLLWHGDSIITIPSFFTYWQNRARGSGNLFGRGTNGEPKTISNVQLGGESCNQVALLPEVKRRGVFKDSASHTGILVTGDHRIIIMTPPLSELKEKPTLTSQRLSSSMDQQLLTGGELAVNDIDRILTGMSNGHTSRGHYQSSIQEKAADALTS